MGSLGEILHRPEPPARLPVVRLRASLWARLTTRPLAWLRSWRCWFGCSCKTLDIDEGIGGQCVRCGKLYGWMTRDELKETT